MPNRPKPSAVVFAKNLTQIAQFYKVTLEMSIVHADPDHIVLNSATFQLVIHAIPKAIADTITISIPPVVREGMPIKLCLPVASLVDARKKAAQLGGMLNSKEKQWQAPGFIACDDYDPEGNVIQVRESTY